MPDTLLHQALTHYLVIQLLEYAISKYLLILSLKELNIGGWFNSILSDAVVMDAVLEDPHLKP